MRLTVAAGSLSHLPLSGGSGDSKSLVAGPGAAHLEAALTV